MARAIDADAVLDRYYAEFEKQDICDGSQDRDWLMRCIEEAPTLTPPNEPLISGFDVIDTKTGEYPDLWEIALKEDWANGLMYCDMEGFAIEEDGTLLLLDECGKHAYCPEGRFKIVPRPTEGEEDT